MFKNRIRIWIIAIIILGSILRFYGLGWGSPFYFHPDERNIAGSISRMYFEKTLNPHFFAYGSFWSYIVLFCINATDFLYKIGNPQFLSLVENFLPKDPFSRAIIFLRIFSALQGIGTIIISYFVGKTFLRQIENLNLKMKNDNAKLKMEKLSNNLTMKQFNNYSSLLLPFLIATSPGLIQASHFGTFESSLTFLYFLIFYLCLEIVSVGAQHVVPLHYYLFVVLIFGISVSIKVTSLVLFPVLLFIFLLINKKNIISLKSLISLIALIFIPVIIFILSNPYSFNFSFLSNGTMKQWSNVVGIFSSDFLSSMNYESGVARGTMQVFYTQQFQQTTPILYQFTKILPYVLNPFIFFLFIFSLLYFVFVIARSASDAAIFLKKALRRLLLTPKADRNDDGGKLLCFTFVFFLSIFLPNSFLFVKWTRYIIPSLPYIYILILVFLSNVTMKQWNNISRFFILFVCLISLVFSLFFTSVYSFDTRVSAAKWAKTNLNPNSKILSEVYDMGIVPFNEVINYTQIRLFNFYDLDDKNLDVQELQELRGLIKQADVIVLPSRRIIDTRLRLKTKYPNGAWFYANLLNGSFGFKLKKSFSHSFDKIIPGNAPDESFTVFDHPEVTIFRR